MLYILRHLSCLLLLLLGLGTAGLPANEVEAEADSTEGSSESSPRQRPYLGFIPDRSASAFAGQGVVIGRVYPNSAVAALELRAGDLLTALNGQAIGSQEDINAFMDEREVGETVAFTWTRDGEEQQGSAALTALPQRRADAQQLEQLRANIRRLQEQRQAQEAAASQEAQAIDTASALQELARVLNALPGQLEETAAAFKELYPEGSFTVHLEIDIRTHASDPSSIQITPEALAPPHNESEDENNESEDETDSEEE